MEMILQFKYSQVEKSQEYLEMRAKAMIEWQSIYDMKVVAHFWNLDMWEPKSETQDLEHRE